MFHGARSPGFRCFFALLLTVLATAGPCAARDEAGAAALVTITEWDLGKMEYGEIPNKIEGADSLRGASRAPVGVEYNGVPCLRFEGGAELRGAPAKVPGLGAGGPFQLEMKFAVNAGPQESEYAGLYQSMLYQKNGFRLVLMRSRTLLAQIYTDNGAAGLVSATTLKPEQFYTVRLVFDGRSAMLYIDGRLDSMIETPPPLPCKEPITVGVASGNNYFFNGWIQSIKVSAPASVVTVAPPMPVYDPAKLNWAPDSGLRFESIQPIAEWRFGEFAHGLVANRVVGADVLRAGGRAPEPVVHQGVSCLRFRGGAELRAMPDRIPGLAEGEPFEVEMRFAVDEGAQDGDYAGLIQAMQYERNGFRLVLTRNRTLLVQMQSRAGATGFSGGKTLKPGQFYVVKLVFAGDRASLYIDGQLDAFLKTQAPTLSSAPILVGVAMGSNYNFNGWIDTLRLSVPVFGKDS